MEHPVLHAIRLAAFEPLGWFEPSPADKIPDDCRFIILIGNAGPHMFRRFEHERDPARETLDAWTKEKVALLAASLNARAVYPFETPPQPFLTWARRAGAGHVSPLGLNIHPTYGLWHAYRAALLFPAVIDLPASEAGPHPCTNCSTRPCLSACPVSAFDGNTYDVSACARHLATPQGSQCMASGCLARHACPVGQAFAYAPEKARFHMRAFLAARQRAEG